MSVDPAFKGAGKREGLELWRVENKEMVKLPKCDGKFHKGDSYILLATTETKAGLDWKLHFWLGSESSQDEMGIAAYKTVELDEILGGKPVQYREIEGHESSQFMSYFKKKDIEYLPGGVASGFVKVERDSYRSRLLHIKGKRVARIQEVPMKASSLNTGDVFILDLGLQLFLFFGENANQTEKSKGVETLTRIKNDDRGGRAKVIFVHEDPKNKDFWNALGGYQEVTTEGTPDSAVERVLAESIKLFKVGAKGFTSLIASGEDGLKRSMLESSNVYILDTSQELHVWIGDDAPKDTRKEAMITASTYLKKKSRPLQTKIDRVVENAEHTTFKSFFPDWSTAKPLTFTQRHSLGVAQKKNSMSSSTLARMALSSKESKEQTVDDGSGKLEIWRVEDFSKVDWPKELYGQFFRGDSYILLYSYDNNSKHIIYFWQGHDSSVDEVGASALLTKELDDEMGGDPIQVRVVQGKEPAHFRSLFKGGMIIHSGGQASGFNNVEDSADDDAATVCYQIRGESASDTCAVQVDSKSESLNSGDCFAVITKDALFLWCGKHADEADIVAAKNIANTLSDYKGKSGREFVEVKEGNEPDGFWNALGGKGPYAEYADDIAVAVEPRLFQVSNATGVVSIEEIHNFDQNDLCNDDVMILDTFVELYIWIGPNSNDEEKERAVAIAKKYNETATDGRSKDIPIIRIVAGQEPIMFTQHFLGWDDEFFKKRIFIDPFEEKMKALKAAEEAKEASTEELEGTITMDDVIEQKNEAQEAITVERTADGYVPYEVLKGIGKVIEGVDSEAREQSLSPDEFKEVFGMSKAEFENMPKWKQVAAKKKYDLF